ncbi:MAG: CPBP family intramembrane metalloprotease [Bacteroidetes bacterium]|nr:MAG: CPBP family intramembrane metalloprotease [Bacteroidota bacterium]
MHEINPTESVPGPVPPPVEQSSRAVKSPPALNDPWYSGRLIPLDGVLERNGFSPLITIFGGLIIGLVLFQGISTVLTFVYILGIKGVPFSDFQADLEGVLVEYAGPLIIFNSVGQVLGLLIPGLLFARMHSSKPFQFLRLRKTDIRYVLLSLLGLIAVFPIVQWIGGAVDSLPWPESVRAFEKAQTDMIQNILDQNFSLPFAISMMALTPAICEEVLFRGYVQRQSERIMGIAGGILFSGMIFGLYHLRPTQAIPLGLLGVYMAYITWRTGSLVPAITVHLANNAFAIFLGKYIQSQGQTAVDLESIQIPFVFVVVGTLLLAGVIYIFWRMADDDAALHKQAITSGSEVNAETQRES